MSDASLGLQLISYVNKNLYQARISVCPAWSTGKQGLCTDVTLSPSELLKGRTALITGGTSGIGYEIAKAYINAGAVCVITGRNQKKLNKACQGINNEAVNKDRIYGLVMDNTEISAMEKK